MNVLDKAKQIEIISALTEGLGIRATARLTGANRETVGKLALDIGKGCFELHDRIMVGIRVNRLELDEAWSFVAKKQKRVERHELFAKGDQYVFIGMAGTQKAIISYHVGKRNGENTDRFIQDLRGRLIGQPEISTDGFLPYLPAIRDAFGKGAVHGQIIKTYSVTHLTVTEAARRYSRRSSRKPRRSKRRPLANLDQLCRAAKSFNPHGEQALHKADKWLFKAAGLPRCGRRGTSPTTIFAASMRLYEPRQRSRSALPIMCGRLENWSMPPLRPCHLSPRRPRRINGGYFG
jgi:hypothetical protein